MKTRVHNISGIREKQVGGEWVKMSPKEQAQYETARETGSAETFGMNYSRMYGRAVEALTGTEQDEGLLQQINEHHPVAAAGGQMLGGTAQSFLPGKLPAQVGIGAIQGALTSPDDRVAGGLMGGVGTVLGDVAARTLGRGVNMLRGGMTSNIPSTRAGGVLEDAGYQTTPGMRTGRQDLRNLDKRILQKGGGADVYGAAMEANQDQFNRQVADAIGVKVDADGEITDAALREFGNEVNQVYSDVTQTLGDIDLGQDFLDQLKELPGIGHRLPRQGTNISGKNLEKLRQSLGRKLKSQDWGDMAYDAIEQIEDIYSDNLPNNVKAPFEAMRKRYRVWKALEKGQALTAGQVNPRSFASNMVRSYGRLRQRDPQIESLIEVSEALKRYKLPEGSPTAESLKGLIQMSGESVVADKYMRGAYVPKMSALRKPVGKGAKAAGAAIGRGLLSPADELMY